MRTLSAGKGGLPDRGHMALTHRPRGGDGAVLGLRRGSDEVFGRFGPVQLPAHPDFLLETIDNADYAGFAPVQSLNDQFSSVFWSRLVGN